MLVLALLMMTDASYSASVAARGIVTFPSEDALLSTADLPMLISQNEANLQGKLVLLDDKLRIGADVSAFAFFGSTYADQDIESGELTFIADHEVASLTPFVALSEYYGSFELLPNLVVTLGKKRTTWGPGQAFSPTDVLNPVRDPTDPSLQRAGFLQARVDAPFETFTLTALVAPLVTESSSGIPSQILVDDESNLHLAGALRAYALVGEADINAWILWTQEYGTSLANQSLLDGPRLALTFSQSLFLEHEFHAEVLLQQGSPRLFPDLDNGVGFSQKLLDSDRILPHILVGWRFMPADGSMLTAEYLYQADGFVRDEFDDAQRLLSLAGRLQRAGVSLPLDNRSSSSEAPNRFAFQPQRRHYLAISYMRPQLMDDFTVQGTLLTPVEDLSLLLSGALTWQAEEWLHLSIFAFAPVPSPARASADLDDDPWQQLYLSVEPAWRGFVPRGAIVNDIPVGEFDALPFRSRLMIEARAFF